MQNKKPIKALERSLIFVCSFVATTFSLLGWLYLGLLSPNQHIWWVSVPMIIFIAIVNVHVITEEIEKNRDDR